MPARHGPTAAALNESFAGLDLNLLVTLDALLDVRSVTAAADRFGITQSAMSHRLAKLRQYFGDALLVSNGDELVLTRRAESLQGPLRDALGGLRDVVAEEPGFDPPTAERTFVLGGADLLEVGLLPSLLAHLAQVAPRVSVATAGHRRLSADALGGGDIDLVVAPGAGTVPGAAVDDSTGIRQCRLMQDGFAVLARRGHPRVRRNLTLKRFLAEGHVLVTPHGQPGSVVDSKLSELGEGRRIRVKLAHFLSAPFLVAETDLLLTCPASLADAVAEPLGLQVFKPPLALPSTSLFLYWHERVHKDPGHRWFREEILALTKAARKA